MQYILNKVNHIYSLISKGTAPPHLLDSINETNLDILLSFGKDQLAHRGLSEEDIVLTDPSGIRSRVKRWK